MEPSKDLIIQTLRQIPDPEIPVIDIYELGILKDVELDFFVKTVKVVITPTYSGCPAMKQIEDDIKTKVAEVCDWTCIVNMVYAPAWTTDSITPEARERLRNYGIVPPEKATVDKSALSGSPKVLKCPRCSSLNTEMISQFGSTACKALFRCKDCLEPFDYFKCI